MSLDFSSETQRTEADDLIGEARRQLEICNACRYCEGYCSVFPAVHAQRAFSDGDITQFANLCHNCRGCYYACQYTEPHEFAINLPQALANVRQTSWQDYAWPGDLGKVFHRNPLATVFLFVLGFMLVFAAATAMRPASGEGFYAYMSHGLMVAIFAPAFLLPLAAIGVSLRHYWKDVGGTRITWDNLKAAGVSAGTAKNLDGGHGDGCNFEDTDRFTPARRYAHQLTLWGFLLCFASTSTGTVLHYVFDVHAPYAWYSLPKIFGVTGGLMLCAGTAWLGHLKGKAEKHLGAQGVWNAEMTFIALLFAVSFTGLVLYAATGTAAVGWLLPLHLGTVLTFFLLMPYSKMAHGFYRFAALVRDAQRKAA